MNPKQFADLAGISANTVRRWCRNFESFLTPSASPDKDQTRVLTEHDVKVLHYVATLRNANQDYEKIHERLRELKEKRWEGLPDVPEGWPNLSQALAPTWHVGQATVAQLSTLQTELSYTQEALEKAQQKITALETEIEELRASQNITEAELHKAQLELANTRADAARLEGHLQQYSLGRDKPINIGLIVIGAMLAAVVIVLIVFVAARLLVG